MGAKFVNIDRDTPMLLPPDLRDWLPEDHMVHFILEVWYVSYDFAVVFGHSTQILLR